MEQICINSPENIVGLIGMIVMGASTLANIIPAPDKATTPVMKMVSRVVHFIAVDIVTSIKKAK